MRTKNRIFALSIAWLYLSFIPYILVPQPPPPARLKPKWIRVEVQVESLYTPVQLGAR